MGDIMKRYFVSYLFNIKEHSFLNFGSAIFYVKNFEMTTILEDIKEGIQKKFSIISKDDIEVNIMFFKELKNNEG